VSLFYFKDRDGQTPLSSELRKGLIPKTINTIGELDEFEEANIAVGIAWLDQYSGDDYMNFAFWMKLHKRLFGEVWNWAGKIRDLELDNPYFRPPHQIRPDLKKLEDDLKYWFEQRTYPDQEIAARFHEKIEAIHPFPNGNGRCGRILTEYICKRQKQLVPTWGKSLKDDPSARRRAYIKSLNEARDTRKYDLLVKFMYS
jgi:Fic-DOC domain mobile mystery protein B